MQEDHNCLILTKILFLTEVIPSIEIQVVIRAVYIQESTRGKMAPLSQGALRSLFLD